MSEHMMDLSIPAVSQEKPPEKHVTPVLNYAPNVNIKVEKNISEQINLNKDQSKCINSISQSKNAIKGKRYKALLALQAELMKYSMKQKLFDITNYGIKALLGPAELQEMDKFSFPLYVEDIRNLLLYSCFGSSPFDLYWSVLEPPNTEFKTVLIEIEGLSVKDVCTIYELFSNKRSVPFMIKILSSNLHFATELSTINFSGFYTFSSGNYSSLFPMNRKRKNSDEVRDITEANNPTENKISKMNLLLKPTELSMEGYPLPQRQFKQVIDKNYIFTKDDYLPVTANSPMFALDCEMGLAASGQKEVLWIAVVNEKLETVYQSFVKPEQEIVDYLTEYSGVNADMLKDVTTTLSVVQNKIRELLPKDAILCGQSLNFDLHALKLIHPYVIDTSVIFNSYSIREKKTSLKKLVKIYLNETIQESSHNPAEDAVAAMKLVLFRLESPLNKRLAQKIKKHSFFARLSSSSQKVCIIGSDDSLRHYCGDIPESITFIKKSSRKEIVEAVSSKSEAHDLILSHLKGPNFCTQELGEEIKGLYGNLPDNTLFLIIFSDVHKNRDANIKFNYGLIMFKKKQES